MCFRLRTARSGARTLRYVKATSSSCPGSRASRRSRRSASRARGRGGARAHRQVLVDDQRHLLARQLHWIVVPPNVHQPRHLPLPSGSSHDSTEIPPSIAQGVIARSLARRPLPPCESGFRSNVTYVVDATRREGGRLRDDRSVSSPAMKRSRAEREATVFYPGISRTVCHLQRTESPSIASLLPPRISVHRPSLRR